MDRCTFTTWDSVCYLWASLGLPDYALEAIELQGGDDVALPSSYKIGHLAQSSIGICGLLAALIYARRNDTSIPKVVVGRQHAVIEFHSEKLYLLNDERSRPFRGFLGGLHATADGFVRIHDSFPNHRDAALTVIGCLEDATKSEVAQKLRTLKAQGLEQAAVNAGAVIFSMRSLHEWDNVPHARHITDFPVTITKLADSSSYTPPLGLGASRKCLSGIRVLELSRVIAAPVAGRTLAAHGADVLWITSQNLPDLPAIDRDTSRGKRTAQLDLNDQVQKQNLTDLLQEADVFLQSYRPGSLAKRGLSCEQLLRGRTRPLVYASLSAWGTNGPWSDRRGFDSIVQTASGMNVSEAEYFGDGAVARVMPCQALDHGAGYFLAAGIMTALYRQSVEGGSYQVDVSLAGVMKYLKSLGRYEATSGFQCRGYDDFEDVPDEFTQTRDCDFGKLQSIRHSVNIQGVEVGWEHMPKPLGSDEPIWLPR